MMCLDVFCLWGALQGLLGTSWGLQAVGRFLWVPGAPVGLWRPLGASEGVTKGALGRLLGAPGALHPRIDTGDHDLRPRHTCLVLRLLVWFWQAWPRLDRSAG